MRMSPRQAILIVLGLIVLVVIGSVVYLMINNNRAQDDAQQQSTTISRYSDDDTKLQFNYPKGWSTEAGPIDAADDTKLVIVKDDSDVAVANLSASKTPNRTFADDRKVNLVVYQSTPISIHGGVTGYATCASYKYDDLYMPVVGISRYGASANDLLMSSVNGVVIPGEVYKWVDFSNTYEEAPDDVSVIENYCKSDRWQQIKAILISLKLS